MKVLLDSLHLNVHTQELYLYPKKLQPHKIKSKLDSGAKGLNTICITIQN